MTLELNSGQKAAAERLDRPVLVSAGAGSGKTRMLTQRFVNAVVPGAVDGWLSASVDEVVAITFTDKAAGEIAERVRRGLYAASLPGVARDVDNAWISTIHGLCSRLLRRHAIEAGVDPLFSVADTLQAGRMRERAFEEAARSLLGEGDDAVTLFERYSYDALFAACVAIVRELAVLGRTAESIVLEPAEDGAKLFAEAHALFRRGMGTCDLGYAGTSSNPQAHAEQCEELLGRCSALVSAEPTEEELLGELLSMLAEYKPLKKLKGIETTAARSAADRLELSGKVAAAMVAPLAVALKRLVKGFSAAYEARKRAAGILDFDDLQSRAVELLESSPELARRYREQFRVVMVDEFQDTDALQLRLVEALSSGDLCTVGDEKQSIYRFRGADVDVYRAHRQRMQASGAMVVELDVNYRSHPDLLGFVNELFASPEYFGGDGGGGLLRLRPPEGTRPTGPVDAAFAGGPRVEALFVDSTDIDGTVARLAEAEGVARRIAELLGAGVKARDVVVLMRSYRHSNAYAEALSREGVQAVVIGGSRFFDLPEVAIMRALNRAIANPEDGQALGILVTSEFLQLSSDALAILRLGSGERDSRSLWTLLRQKSSALDAEDRAVAQRLVAVLEAAGQRIGRTPLAEVLLVAVEEAGWDLRLLSAGNVGRDAFANVLKFARQASAFEASEGTGPAGFGAQLDAKQRLGDTEAPASLADDNSDAVRIMSVHASKGLEFPIVVVPELAARGSSDALSVRTAKRDGTLEVALKTPAGDNGEARPGSTWFSAFSEVDARAGAEESARVLYVAFTRAQEALLLSGSMGLRPQRGSAAKHDLARLARFLGLAMPVEGPCDAAVSVPGMDSACRLRVVDASEAVDSRTPSAPNPGGLRLAPPAGAVTQEASRDTAPERLSYTQLSEFERCPRQFWVRRVLGVHSVDAGRTGKADPLRFGTALHAVLRLVTADGQPPESLRIETIARYFELDAADTARLRTTAQRYCDSEISRRANAGAVVRRESPFVMRVGGRFLLAGSIDLYSRTGAAGLVVDYKSGATGEAEELEGRYELQARCYALAVLRDGCEHVSVEFVRPEVIEDDGSMQRISYAFESTAADDIEGELSRRYDEIASSTFEPRPTDECRRCDVPGGLCPSARMAQGND